MTYTKKQLRSFKRAARRVEVKARVRDRMSRSFHWTQGEKLMVSMFRRDAKDMLKVVRYLKAAALNLASAHGYVLKIRRVVRRMDTEPRADMLSVMPRSIYFGW